MNIKIKFYLALLIFYSFFGAKAIAQNSVFIGALPALNINYKLSNKWSLNSKIETRQQLYKQSELGWVDRQNKYLLSDASLLIAKKMGFNTRVALGYLLRIEDNDFAHRFIQQIILLRRYSSFRLAHRFLCDQTFSSNEKTQVRLRYRNTIELPFNGKLLDEGEFYLKSGNELIISYQDKTYDLELRLIPLIGYNFFEFMKLESGIDYRINSFINGSSKNNVWFNFNLFIEI